MHRHSGPESGDLLRKTVACLRLQAADPRAQRAADRVKQTLAFFGRHLGGESQRGEARGVRGLCGVGVPDAVERARVGERELTRVGDARARSAELLERARVDVTPA